MKKLIVMLLMIVNSLFGWEINTHRAIERKAVEKSENLKTFVKNSGIENQNYNKEKFEGYKKSSYLGDYTYADYVTNGEKNGISYRKWKQIFNVYNVDYQDLIEAGSILEDAMYPNTSLSFNGRFNNHFYDAQNGGHALTYGFGRRTNAVKWGFEGIFISESSGYSNYAYLDVLNYFVKGFLEKEPAQRRKYQAKMLVGVGSLLHLMNDMTSPAHTRDDSHPLGDPMEIYGRGGENGNESKGFRVVRNGVVDNLGISARYSGSINLPNIPKYGFFSDFIRKESMWTATHFFSNDTVFQKPLPQKSDTYEELVGSGRIDNGGIEKYYIRNNANNGTPIGMKMGIHIKSYILLAMQKIYQNGTTGVIPDTTSSFRGDYSVLKENARILIPRAIANARNFLDYFFRIQIEAKIDDENIIIKNVSNPSLAKEGETIMYPGTFFIKYDEGDGILHNFTFEIDLDRCEQYACGIESMGTAIYSGGFFSLSTFAPGKSISIPFKRDTSIKGKKFVVFYRGTRNTQDGFAVTTTTGKGGGIIERER